MPPKVTDCLAIKYPKYGVQRLQHSQTFGRHSVPYRDLQDFLELYSFFWVAILGVLGIFIDY